MSLNGNQQENPLTTDKNHTQKNTHLESPSDPSNLGLIPFFRSIPMFFRNHLDWPNSWSKNHFGISRSPRGIRQKIHTPTHPKDTEPPVAPEKPQPKGGDLQVAATDPNQEVAGVASRCFAFFGVARNSCFCFCWVRNFCFCFVFGKGGRERNLGGTWWAKCWLKTKLSW